ncbi:MAG: DUF1801 domain-containing protein [Saprospiraceae bacterium]|nr:DUF1801 domain-containing protein [Saprospiraceae bacterium]
MGKLVEIKTKQTDASVESFLNKVADETKRKDSFVILEFMKKHTKEIPKLWGSSMIGFGNMRYKSPATGREVDWFKIGFSPRKANISFHLGMHMSNATSLFPKLGKHKTSVGCLYINKLEDVNIKVLEEIIKASIGK